LPGHQNDDLMMYSLFEKIALYQTQEGFVYGTFSYNMKANHPSIPTLKSSYGGCLDFVYNLRLLLKSNWDIVSNVLAI
jgi:hypothetical protein